MDFLSLTLKEIEDEFLANKLLKYQAKQVYDWFHVKRVKSFDEMTNISVALRETLKNKYEIKSLKILGKRVSKTKDTVKYLYELSPENSGETIETVLMKHKDRVSLCISSQVGCRMGCKFCAGGTGGFVRNLTPSEMLLQVYEHKDVNNIVIMGIGEPLDNYDNLLRFLELSPVGARHISVSTCGLVPQIDALAKERSGLTLSVSLHAATDEERCAIMPINLKYPLKELMRACRDYFTATGRRISFEYALIAGINDSEEHARKLAELLRRNMQPHAFHVNLIPVNPVNSGFIRSEKAHEFAEMLAERKINATIRRTMGDDINAACGQLRRREMS
jgi:23S rRNA (adenine2503-C2)-methyltransferase